MGENITSLAEVIVSITMKYLYQHRTRSNVKSSESHGRHDNTEHIETGVPTSASRTTCTDHSRHMSGTQLDRPHSGGRPARGTRRDTSGHSDRRRGGRWPAYSWCSWPVTGRDRSDSCRDRGDTDRQPRTRCVQFTHHTNSLQQCSAA